jgi:hypothetical protein
MHYHINTQNVKKSVSHLSSYFKKKGYSVPYSDILEAFSHALFTKNYNTLEAKMKEPITINDIKQEYKYIIEIVVDMPEEKMLEIIKNSLKEANCLSSLESFYHKDNQFTFILNLEKNSNNTLTALFLLSENMKKICIPKKMDFCRIQVEKQSFMAIFKPK